MSTLLSEEELVRSLREILKSKRVSLRDISRDLEVPYRSVQNYIGGETRMPAAFFLNLCVYIGLEPDFLATQDFRPREDDLYDAVWNALHRVEIFKKLPYRISNSRDLNDGDETRIQSDQIALARKITVIIAEQYDRYRREWLDKKYLLRVPRKAPRTLPSEPEVDQ